MSGACGGLAVDFVAGAIRGDFEVGIIFSEDTDLHPALEAVGALKGPGGCALAIWRDPRRSGPRSVMSGGKPVYTHVLKGPDFYRVSDSQDYTQSSARKMRPPRR